MAKTNDLGKQLVDALKAEFTEKEFRAIYIKPRDEAYPDELDSDDLLVDIRRMFMKFLEAISNTLKKNLELEDFVFDYVTPYYEDSCDYLTVYQGRVLYKRSCKPWSFYFETLKGLKEEMVSVYNQMEANLDKHLEEQRLLAALKSDKVTLVDINSITPASIH